MPRASGYALVLVMVVLALLSVGLGTMFNTLATTSQTTAAVTEQRRVFYACDGTARGLVQLARQHLRTGAASSLAVARALCSGGGGGCTVGDDGVIALGDDPLPLVRPAGFTISGLEARSLNPTCVTDGECGPGGSCVVEGGAGVCRTVASLPNGPFRGVPARQDAVLLAVEQTKGEHRCRVQQTLVFGKLSLFQFVVFSDLDYTDWQPRTRSAVPGRVHTNGTLCLGGQVGLYLEHVTSAGDVHPMQAAECRTPGLGAEHAFVARKDGPRFDVDGVQFTIDPAGADFEKLQVGDRQAGGGWASHARATWAGHLLDRAHDITPLKLPLSGTLRVHHGIAADGTVTANDTNLRFLLEPVRFRRGVEDSASIRARKFAQQATLRIIDGVWYVRRGVSDWPGQPIWSDHPGRYTTRETELVPAGIPVGQDQLFPGGAARPRRYSPYRHSSGGGFGGGGGGGGTGNAVVTYGVLHGASAFNRVVPGFRPAFGGTTMPAFSMGDFLEGTRSGFRNGHAQRALAPGIAETATSTPANVLPINFDMAAFQQALASNEPGELGRRLTDLGIAFNGIIFIAASWPGSEDALATNALAALQAQGAVDDVMQPVPSTAGQRALPDALCSEDLSGQAWASGTAFRVGQCGAGSRPAAVRLINGRHVHFPTTRDPFLAGEPVLAEGALRLPAGLTIVTPLPLYLMGDMNLSANAREMNPASPNAQWVPLLVGGDVITVLSNGWRDDHARWDRNVSESIGLRQALPTTLHVAAIGGVTSSRSGVFSGGVDRFFRVLENWSNRPLTVRGSIVLSHAAVYDRWAPSDAPAVGTAPELRLAFDRHLDDLARHPPGAPVFDVTAVRAWQRH